MLRAWLAMMLRGKVGHRRRGRSRRAFRERAVARPECDSESDADLIVSRAESSRMLVKEVMALGEPHQSVLMLRYFEGLDGNAIGAELGISPEAVRSRLGRAHRKLRQRLDTSHGGDREMWISALLPVAGWSAAPATVTTFATGGALIAMKLTLALIVSAAALILTQRMLEDEPRPVAGLSVPRAESGEQEGPAPGEEPASIPASLARSERSIAGTAAGKVESPIPTHAAIGEDGLFRPLLVGTVKNELGQGVGGAELVASWGRFESETPVYARVISDEDGAYRLQLPARALISEHSHVASGNDRMYTSMFLNLWVSADGYGPFAQSLEYPHGEPSVFEQSIVLAAEEESTGWSVQVVDVRGEPVGKVQVGLFGLESGRLLVDQGYYFWLATDSRGRVSFDRRPGVAVIPVAYTQDRWLGWAAAQAPVEEGPVQLTVEVGEQPSLSGQVLDSAGRPVADSSVRFGRALEDGRRPDLTGAVRAPNLPELVRPWQGLATEAGTVRTGHEGGFRAAGLLPGDYWLRLADDSVHGPFDLGSHGTLRLTDRYQLSVRAVDTEGRVVRGARIDASSDRTGQGGSSVFPPSGWQTFALSAGEWTLTAAYGDAEPAERTVRIPEDLGQGVELILDFEVAPLPLTLVPLDPEGGLLAGGAVEVQRTGGASGHNSDPYPCTGQPIEASLRPGTYSVTAKPPLDNPLLWLPVTTEWEQERQVEPRSLELHLQRGGRLDFTWVGSLSESWPADQDLGIDLHSLETGRRFPMGREGGFLSAAGTSIESAAGPELDPAAGRQQPGPVLLPGDYDLTLEAEGLLPQRYLVRIVAGEVSAVSVALEPAN